MLPTVPQVCIMCGKLTHFNGVLAIRVKYLILCYFCGCLNQVSILGNWIFYG